MSKLHTVGWFVLLREHLHVATFQNACAAHKCNLHLWAAQAFWDVACNCTYRSKLSASSLHGVYSDIIIIIIIKNECHSDIIVDRLQVQDCGHSKKLRERESESRSSKVVWQARGVSCKNARTVQFSGGVERCPVTRKTVSKFFQVSLLLLQISFENYYRNKSTKLCAKHAASTATSIKLWWINAILLLQPSHVCLSACVN